MDEGRAEGTERDVGGKTQEELDRASGSASTQAKGQINKAAGTTQDVYGQAKDWFRETIETQPYTATIVALGIGWLLGRLHRPF